MVIYLILKCRQKTNLKRSSVAFLVPQFPTAIDTDTSLKKLAVTWEGHQKPALMSM